VTLDERGLGSSSIIVRMSAIRKLAVEAMDNGLLAPELAAGIQRVKSAKSIGVRAGNWLSLKQAQALLNAPDITTLKGLRDRAIIAVLLGCALRRCEVAALTDGRSSRGFTLEATVAARHANTPDLSRCGDGTH
jgi:site-specific recombinase XerC